MKYLKTIAAVIFIGVGLLGLILFFSFKDIKFTITNKTDHKLKAYITIASLEQGKEYTYPLLGGELITPGEDVETFYTLDQTSSDSTCKRFTLKTEGDEVLLERPCPDENEVITLE